MTDIKITRWATYLVPGSLVVFTIWYIVKYFSITLPLCMSAFPDLPGSDIYLFLVTSYVVGIGLWGLGYSNMIQRFVFRDPHHKRVLYVRAFLRDGWRQEKYRQRLTLAFPEMPIEKTESDSIEYADFQYVLISTYFCAPTELKERIVRERETIGLLQCLILVFLLVTSVLAVIGLAEVVAGKLMGLVLPALSAIVTIMLYLHFYYRNYYLARDVILAFLEGDKCQC